MNKGKLTVCSRGHKFYKSSEMPTCPTCWPGQYKKEKVKRIIEVLRILAERLAATDVKWVVGGSCSLMVHGIDVVPNDVDFVVDLDSFEEAKLIFEDMATGDGKAPDGAIKVILDINGIEGEMIERPVDEAMVIMMEWKGVELPVYSLRHEYEFYKQRTDKPEANRKKIALIEKKLGIS